MIEAHFTDEALRVNQLGFDRSYISCRTRNLGALVSRDTEVKLGGKKSPLLQQNQHISVVHF